MKPKTVMWALIGGAILVLLLYSMFRPASGGVQNVDAAGVRAAVEGGAQLIDVRTAGEFQLGHIAGAVNVPLDQLQASAQNWDRNATYVVYCASGSRSATAVESMKALGFGNIRHFNAGIQAWDGGLEKGQATGQKVETSGKPVMIEFFTDS